MERKQPEKTKQAQAMRLRLHAIFVLCALATAVLLASCGSSSSSATPAKTAPSTVALGTASAFGTAAPAQQPPNEVRNLSVAFISATHGWLGRSRDGKGEVLVTDDGGGSWSQQYVGYVTPELMQFVDMNNGWMVGCLPATVNSGHCDPPMLTTHDGGRTWTPVTSLRIGQVVAMAFVSPMDGWVLADACLAHCGGGPAQLLLTLDGGTTWQRSHLPQNAEVPLSLKRLDARTAWVLTESHVFATGDGGITWTTEDNPCHLPQPGYDSGFEGGPFDFVDVLHGWIGCTNSIRFRAGTTAGKIFYRTTDGARTWHIVAWTGEKSADVGQLSVGGSITDVLFFDVTTGWLDLDGPQSFLYQTNDGGQTWVPIDDGVGGGGISHLFFIDAVHGWALGSVLLRTDDGGTHWEQVATPP